MGARAVFGVLRTTGRTTRLHLTTVQWSSYVLQNLAIAFSLAEDENSVANLFERICSETTHIGCVGAFNADSNASSKSELDAELQIALTGSEEEGVFGACLVQNDGKREAHKAGSAAAAMSVITRHDHNQDGISVLFDSDTRVFYFTTNKEYGPALVPFVFEGEDGTPAFTISRGEWIRATIPDLVALAESRSGADLP